MTEKGTRIIEGVPLASVADRHASGDAFDYLERRQPACHSDTGEVLIDAVLPLPDCIIYSPSFRRFQYVAAIVRGRIFAIGFGQRGVAARLPPEQSARALAEGEKTADYFGAEWIALELFRAGWSRSTLESWVRIAYEFALRDTLPSP